MSSNIDRYLAIWQATYPNGWRDPDTKELKEGLESLKDGLKPLFKQDKSFWTSLDAEDTKALGYTYADVRKTSEETKKLFRHRHDWSIQTENDVKDWKPTPPTEMEPLDLSAAQVYVNHPEYVQPTPTPEIQYRQRADPTPEKSTTKSKRREWFIDDVVERLVITSYVECKFLQTMLIHHQA